MEDNVRHTKGLEMFVGVVLGEPKERRANGRNEIATCGREWLLRTAGVIALTEYYYREREKIDDWLDGYMERPNCRKPIKDQPHGEFMAESWQTSMSGHD